MNKPYHERPDWILKSIVYFCDNYTIDGKDLRKYKATAIKNHTPGYITCSGSWVTTEPGSDFWDCFFYLHTGTYLANQITTCKPWTDYEKRKIAKMPEVK
jgi:hypothetical protein